MPVLERANLRKKEDLCFEMNLKSENCSTEKWIGKSTDECLTSDEKSYLSYIDPAFSPSLSRALISAKELLKHAEKRLTEFGAYEHEIQQLLREESFLTNDKTLQHIYQIISKKLEDIHNSKSVGSSQAPSTISKKSSTKSRSPKLAQPKAKPKIHYDHNEKVRPSYCSLFKAQKNIEPKKVYTARSVQTDFEKTDPEKKVEENDCKIRKWNIQNAPVVDIPPSLKLQKLKSVHISPDCSKIFNIKNAGTYNFKYNCPSPTQDSNISEAGKPMNGALSKDHIPERDTDVTTNRVTEKPPKVPNKSPKPFACQKHINVGIRRARKKLNYNDSLSSNISLENIHLSDVDKILQRNNEKLDTVSQKTSKICKALHRHVVNTNFKNYEQNSSTDQVPNSVTLDLISSNFETPSESNQQKDKSREKETKRHQDTDEHLSINSSDYHIFENLSTDQGSGEEERIVQVAEKNVNSLLKESFEENRVTQNVIKLVHVESMEINNSVTGSAEESERDEICKADQVKIDDFMQHIEQVEIFDKNKVLGNKDKSIDFEEEISPEDDQVNERLVATELVSGSGEKEVNESDRKVSETSLEAVLDMEGKMLNVGLVEPRKNLSDELNNEQRYRKYVRKCVDMNKSLAEQISFRINEEMQLIIEKTEKELSILKSSSTEGDGKRSTEMMVPKMDKKTEMESEISEGEIHSSKGCTFSQGEVKCSNSASSKELDMNYLNKINSFIDISNSSSSVSFSLGEVWEKTS